MKKLVLILGLVMIFVSGVLGVECNADLTQGGNSCTVSASLTLNGSYVVSGNNSNYGYIIINAHSVFLDLNNTELYGNSTTNSKSWGIKIDGKYNVTIKNGVIRDYTKSIVAQKASNVTLKNITFYNYSTAIHIFNNNSLITECNFYQNESGSEYAIDLERSHNHNISFNIFNYTQGIDGDSAYNVTIESNNFSTGVQTNAIYFYRMGMNYSIINNYFHDGKNQVDFLTVGNINTSNNKFYNLTNFFAYRFKHSAGITVDNDKFDYMGKAIHLHNASNVYLKNFNASRLITGKDGWDVGIVIMNESRNVFLRNFRIEDSDRGGVCVMQNHYPVSIKDGYINIRSNADKVADGDTELHYRVPAALKLGQEWNYWHPTLYGWENDTANNLTNTGVSNIKIENITFGDNVQVLLKLQNYSNVTWDNSISNYWFRKFQTPTYLWQPEEYYIKNTATNVSSVYNLAYLDLFGIAYMNIQKTRFKLFSDYLYFQNVMDIQNQTIVYNLTSSNSVYNCTLSSGSILVNTQANLTLQPNKYCYIGY